VRDLAQRRDAVCAEDGGGAIAGFKGVCAERAAGFRGGGARCPAGLLPVAARARDGGGERGRQEFRVLHDQEVRDVCPRSRPRERSGNLVGLIDAILTGFRRPRGDEERKTLDNWVSCLGALVVEMIGDAFPLADYAPNVLPWIPATCSLEENPDITRFFVRMLGRSVSPRSAYT